MILKIAGMVFLILLAFNWLCIIGSRQIKDFGYVDFVLIFLVTMIMFSNLPRVRSTVIDVTTNIPDLIDIAMFETKKRFENVSTGIDDTKDTVNIISEFYKDVAKRELERQMKYEIPK